MATPLFFESILDTNTLKRLKKSVTSRNVPPPPFSRFLRNRDPVRNYDPGNWVLNTDMVKCKELVPFSVRSKVEHPKVIGL